MSDTPAIDRPTATFDVSQTETDANASQQLQQLSILGDLIRDDLEREEGDDIAPFRFTNEAISEQVTLLERIVLSDQIDRWVNRYDQVGERNPYLWTWCRRGIELTTLPCVGQEYYDSVCDTKLLGVMFDVLVDDVADQGGDVAFLDELIGFTTNNQLNGDQACDQSDSSYACFAAEVWEAIHGRVKELPRYDLHAELLKFDYAQLMNTMRYSHLLNREPTMLNLAEHDLYLPHNMHMMVSATIDLMASPEFDLNEIGRLREAVWNAQYMGRIGNLVTTWQRELHEHDYTSGVFAHAVIHGGLTPEMMEHGDRDLLEQAINDGGHEEYFLDRWQECRRNLIRLQPTIHSFDLRDLVGGLESLICLHLASRGRK